MANEKQPTAQPLIGEVQQDQIDAWKKEYPNGFIGIKGGGHIAYFKHPNRHEANLALSKANIDAALDMYQETANLCFIGGSDQYLKNEKLHLGVMQKIKTLLEGEACEVVNF